MFILFLFIEILIFSYFSDHYGFLRAAAGYFLPSLLGVLLFMTKGGIAMGQLHQKLSATQRPDKVLLHSLSFFIAAILTILPFFITRVLAIFLFLPGLRNLIIFYLIKKLRSNGVFQFKTFDNNQTRDINNVYDTHVIDVSPTEIIYTDKKND